LTELKNIGSPKEFWDYFKEISKIPRCSGKEDQIRNFIQKTAISFKYDTKIDSTGNLVVKVYSKTKDKKNLKIIFQCHMDIVCEKEKDISHNFSNDPLNLEIIRLHGEDWLTAKGTTLGADNGVGIAYCLTLMNRIYNKKININNLAIEFLFTVEEETGLTGAFNIVPGFIDGKYLINLDSEEDDTFTIGCAGGIDTRGELKIKYENVNEKAKKLIPLQLTITELLGGHSGIDINKGRGNAIKILSDFLWKINKKYGILLNSISGGKLSNTIPREANAIIYCREEKYSDVSSYINQIISEIIKQFPDENIKIALTKLDKIENDYFISKQISDKLFHILYIIPNGPILNHPNNPNLVHTSTNLASIKIEGNKIIIITSQRSIDEISKRNLYEKIEALFNLADLDIIIKHTSDYPGWTPDFESKLLQIAQKSYKELFDKNVNIQTIHAGLETGILKQKFPKMEMISIGPLIEGGHSPNEKLKIKSVEKIWKLIEVIIKNFN